MKQTYDTAVLILAFHSQEEITFNLDTHGTDFGQTKSLEDIAFKFFPQKRSGKSHFYSKIRLKW